MFSSINLKCDGDDDDNQKVNNSNDWEQEHLEALSSEEQSLEIYSQVQILFYLY